MNRIAEDAFDVAGIADRIARRRQRLGLRQLELARRAGVSEAYISRLESGAVRNPKIKDLAVVGQALGIPLDGLVSDRPRRIEQETLTLLARQTSALASLVRGLQYTEPEDREFVLSYVEALARRFGE